MPAKSSMNHKSVKHEIIDKNNTKTVASVGVATFIVIFCLFAGKTIFDQSLYLNRVVAKKEVALRQLLENQDSLDTLESSYNAFATQSENILSGNPGGEGPIDGGNTKLVLDALPNSYDYPALSSSFEKILKGGGYDIDSIGGSEDSGVVNEPTGDVSAIEIPYNFAFTATTERTKELLQTLERSIRPMHIDSIYIKTSDSSLTTRINLHTYYTQPKTFELDYEEVE